MFEPRNPDFVNRVRESFARQGIMQHIGAAPAKVEPGFVEIHVPHLTVRVAMVGMLDEGRQGV